MSSRKSVPVLYVDIDGTIRHGKDEMGRFVNGPEDVQVFDGVPERLARYKAAGWRVVGVSNQGGIALGYTTTELVALAMTETLRQCGFSKAIDTITWCEHHPDATELEQGSCWCRKPRPGMVIETAAELATKHPDEAYPPHLALMVGDRLEDAQCAAAANVRFMDAAAWRHGQHDDQIGGAA